jgi:RNA polymerase sigma-70 factor, ECF subfamily
MNDFGRLLERAIPRLRRYARALTRDVSRADDLVQDTLVRAIARQHHWHARAIGCSFSIIPSSTPRSRNCGPPNTICAVNIENRPLDAALR